MDPPVDPVDPPVDPVDPPVDPVVEIPEEDVPLVEIPEEDVPLAEVPETGDALVLWIAAAVSSLLGLIWLVLDEKKRRTV